MEALLHWAWEAKTYTSLTLVGTHEPIEVIDPGTLNNDVGADFVNAKIKIGDLLWVGSIEIHTDARDWINHQHESNPLYNSVILHVVEHPTATCRAFDGREIAMAQMTIPQALKERAQYLTNRAHSLACSPLAGRIPPNDIEIELTRLYTERLQKKAQQMIALWDKYHDWYSVLYISLMRSLGLGQNSDSMERLALSLPLRHILHHRDQPLQVEALLIGQSGLLSAIEDATYRQLLEREYAFLAHKYELTPIENISWRWARTRPASNPLKRILQVSTLLRHESLSVDLWIKSQDNPRDARLFEQVQPSQLALKLYPRGLNLSREVRHGLILNLALPLCFAWQLTRENSIPDTISLQEHARAIPAEENNIIKKFATSGLNPRHALDSQALIERYKAYCIPRKCIYCAWGRALLSKPLHELHL